MCFKSNRRVSPKLSDAIIGFFPKDFSLSECHPFESLPPRYKLNNTALNLVETLNSSLSISNLISGVNENVLSFLPE